MIKKVYKQIFSEKKRIKIRLLFNKLISFFYRGNKLECNVCKKSFRQFKPKGNWVLRKNAVCPYCGSLERGRVLLFYLKNETNFFSSNKKSVLHFAPEWNLVPILKNVPNIHYITADINPNYADEQIDITNIPYPDNTFDYIICSHVLGHVPDENKAIKELLRVLKKDGVALILTLINWLNKPTYESSDILTDIERLDNYSEPDLMRLHGSDFSKRLENNGFNVETIDYRLSLPIETQNRFSLGNGDRETIFKCTK